MNDSTTNLFFTQEGGNNKTGFFSLFTPPKSISNQPGYSRETLSRSRATVINKEESAAG
jgi:hypothetical protein